MMTGAMEHLTDLFIAWAEQNYTRLLAEGNLVNALEEAYRAGYADAHTEMKNG